MALHPDFISELRRNFRGAIRTDAATRVLYSTDASIFQIEPLGVALPETQEDLIAAVELAAKYKIPILPRGSGSSLAGQAVAQALVLDCSRHLDHILSLDPESASAVVEPGVVLATLNRAAAKHNLMFGPDPASAERATLGGVIGNNATGAHSITYGMSADHLLAANVILSDGSLASLAEIDLGAPLPAGSRYADLARAALRIREQAAAAIQRDWPRAWRNSAGYRLNYLLPWSASQPPQWAGDYPPRLAANQVNLAPLLAGSEGTLALMRQLTVRLVPRPRHTILAVLSYPGIAAACDAVPALLEHGPSAVELIPQMLIRLARSVPAYAGQLGFVRGDPAALLVVEFSGANPFHLREKAAALGPDVVIAESAADQAKIWSVRKVGLGIIDSRPTLARPVAFIEDCAIPVERLGEFVREVEQILSAHQTEAAFYAHASAGTLHIRPMLNLKTQAGAQALRSIAEQVLALTLRVGGAMSSEHGDGLVRSEWLTQTYGEELVESFRALKRAADPDGLLNPKKLTDAPPMDSHLRYTPAYQPRAWNPNLDFSEAGSLALAIEQCNGQGVCRKENGLMCPSFQATREEQNSTRGRANLLRALISAPAGELRTDDVYAALDLCLACKGCTSECPSGVDMAKLKYEFKNEYYKTHRRPLRDYLFGYFHYAAAGLAAVAPLSNAMMQWPFARDLSARLFQIAPSRPFPRFSLTRARATRRGNRPAVIFLVDPFSHYVEPQLEQAAFDLLDFAGFDVRPLSVMASGASLLAKGMLDAARRHAESVCRALEQIDPQASLPLVGIEPPEIYTVKHDYFSLLPGRRAALEKRASQTWLLEEFLLRAAPGPFERLPRAAGPVYFHPHCHQRAEAPAPDGLPAGTEASMALLRLSGFDPQVSQAGCCGMAGTFGYEAEHAGLSMQVGALQLFPQVRAASPETVITASGAACRMQIEQGTGVTARHPIVLLADQLKAIR